MTQLIQFEGCTVAVIAPEDLEAMEAELAALREEVEEQAGLIKRLSDLLNSAVNVLRGPPPDDTLWSFHDVAERAEALRARVAELEAALRYAGKHPEDCVRDDPGPCTSHMAYLEVEARVAALEAWLRTYDAWLEQPHPQGGTNLDHVPDGQPINADEVLRATESAGAASKPAPCAHEWTNDDEAAVCAKCGEHAEAWYCPDAPDHLCKYSTDPDSCDYCGQPEERK